MKYIGPENHPDKTSYEIQDVVPPQLFNLIVKELCNVVIGSGLVPSEIDDTQVFQAIHGRDTELYNLIMQLKEDVAAKYAEHIQEYQQHLQDMDDRLTTLKSTLESQMNTLKQTTTAELNAAKEEIRNVPRLGSPNPNDRPGIPNGWVADCTTIVYFECNIGHFDIYINGIRIAEGRDSSYDGYDQRQCTVIVPKGARLSWSGACWILYTSRMNA